MATINPKGTTQEGAQSFLGYSSGAKAPSAKKYSADTSGQYDVVGGALKSVGDLFGLTVKAGDEYYQNQIKDELQANIDDVRGEFGVESATNIQEDVRNTTQPTPSELTRSQDHLETLTEQVKAGKLKESHYWARVNSVARQLRYRYPEYRDQIDRMTSSMVGTNPANALRNSLMNEAEAAASSVGKLTEVEKFVNAHGQYVPQNYFKNPQNYNLLRLQEETFARQRAVSEINVEKSRLELETSRDARTSRKAAETLSKDIAIGYSNIIDAAAGSVGRDYATIFEKLKNAQKNPGAISPEEQVQLQNGFAQLRLSFNEIIDATLAQPAYDVVDANKKKEIKDFHMGRLASLEQALTDKNFGLVGAQLRQATIATDATAARILTDDRVRNMSAVAKILPPEVAATYFGVNQERLKDAEAGVNDVLSAEVMSGQTGLGDAMQSSKNAGVDNPRAQRSLIDNVVKVITDPRMPTEMKASTIKGLYAKNGNFFDKITPKEAPNEFVRLANPAMAKAVYAMRDANPQLWDDYKKWTLDSGTVLAQRFANDVRNIRLNRTFLDVGYDPAAKSFFVYEIPGAQKNLNAVQRSLNNVGEYFLGDKESAQTKINELNKYVRGIDSVFSTEGGDTSRFVQTLLQQNLGLDLQNTEKQGSFIENFLGSLSQAMSPAQDTGTVSGGEGRSQVKGGEGTENLRGSVLPDFNALSEDLTIEDMIQRSDPWLQQGLQTMKNLREEQQSVLKDMIAARGTPDFESKAQAYLDVLDKLEILRKEIADSNRPNPQ